MIARHDGAVVFVSGAIPGETVEADVERVQRGLAWAVTRTVLDPSSDRLPATDLDCGGCVLAHVRYDRQLRIKQEILEDGLRRIGHLTLAEAMEMVPSPVDGYRMRARLHVRNGRIGFFREGTHTVCDPSQTRQLTPATLAATGQLAQALRETDPSFEGEVDLAENIGGSERAFHLEVSRSGRGGRLASDLQPVAGFTGGSLSIGRESRTREVWGSPLITDTLRIAGPASSSMALVRHVRAFFQSNRFLIEPLVDHVCAAMAPGLVLDLYAGVGLFAIAAATGRGGEVLAIEGDEIAAANLRRNASQSSGGVRVRSESVENFFAGPHAQVSPATVVVDPPRTGLSRAAVEGVLGLRATRLVYVSCDVATLARDARLLCDGGYAIEQVRAFDLFPQTAHVETVIVFSR